MPRKPASDTKTNASPLFTNLTWNDLESWVGERILARAKRYQKNRAVKELVLIDNDQLLAKVQGSHPYSLYVSIDDDGALDSQCTCPYRYDCKHAAAAVIEAVLHLKDGRDIPPAETNPSLYQAYFDMAALDALAPLENDSPSDETMLENYLSSLPRSELEKLTLDLARKYPDIRHHLLDLHNARADTPASLIKSLRNEISHFQDSCSEYGNDHETAGSIARILSQLKLLISNRHSDEVLLLYAELQNAISTCIEHDHECVHQDDLAEIYDTLYQAFRQSSRSQADQLAIAIDLSLNDEYALTDHALSEFLEAFDDESAWKSLAARLLPCLNRDTKKGERDYRRDLISGWIIEAYDRSGSSDKATRICAAEAPITNSFERLVHRLMQLEKWDDALDACIEGINTNQEDNRYPGITSSLRRDLKKIYHQTGQRESEVALTADEFFASPNYSNYRDLLKACRSKPERNTAEKWMHHFLEYGISPYDKESQSQAPDLPIWPFPKPIVTDHPICRPKPSDAPYHDTLIKIAIAAKKPDQVMKWWTLKKAAKNSFSFFDDASEDSIAEALKDKHPEESLDIWSRSAQRSISRVTPHGYQDAVPYIKNIKRLLESIGQKERWQTYYEKLCQANRRRPRCIEILHHIENGSRKISE